ncbi:MAG: ATP-binding protein [Candidatus Dadabacteria bacterium]|nr:ATP-binding protein [Candidatus Dadabacteria bacterium]MDE0477371.1 ATP-binding protein [Candidatus Dadabacteria bacterium]
MKSFQRSQVAVLCDRLAEPPHHIITIFGPRQTGKTTIVQQALRRIDVGSRYLAVDEPRPPGPRGSYDESETIPVFSYERGTDWLVRVWEEARREAQRSGRGFVLALDEIQRIPQWSQTLKGLWDADRAQDCPLHVVILGSAPLLMQSGLNESLAGRFEPIRVAHWSFEEMSNAFGFSLDEYLYFGGYPGSAKFVQDLDRWRAHILQAIVMSSIGRDILSMTRVDKPELLKRLFEHGADYSGQILSYTKMLGQLMDAGNTTTLARYLDLLSDAGLLVGFGKYHNKSHLRKGSSPKLNVLNTALMTVGSGYSFEEAMADRTFRGRIVESAVGAHLSNTATPDISVYYWRDKSLEVDFVLRRGPHLIPVEVKSGRKSVHLGGIEAFKRNFGARRSLLVGEGGIPLHEFFTVPVNQWFEEK